METPGELVTPVADKFNSPLAGETYSSTIMKPRRAKIGDALADYKLLSKGANNSVFAIDDQLVAKRFDLGNPAARLELELLQALHNEVPGLAPKPHRLEYTPNYEHELLVMDRLYPLQNRAIDLDTRKQMLDRFAEDINRMHKVLAHGDIQRKAQAVGGVWDNIIPTEQGLRLIDFGLSVPTTDSQFQNVVRTDLADLRAFKNHWLTP